MALAKRWRPTIGRKMLKMGEIIDTAVATGSQLALSFFSRLSRRSLAREAKN